MTIKDKISLSSEKMIFTLFKEGLFLKCYNEDAMLFAQKVKPYKVNSKYVKCVGAQVLSLGFPESEVAKNNLRLNDISKAIGAKHYQEETHGIVFSLQEEVKQNYKVYESIIIAANESDTTIKHEHTHCNNLVKKITEFDLANTTPMQGLVFIQELKEYIKTLE